MKTSRFALMVVAVALTVHPACGARMIGYWQAWSKLPLGQISPVYDVIDLSFGVPNRDGKTITFSQDVESDDSLKVDVSVLHALHKCVLLSIGGEGANKLTLLSPGDARTFDVSVESIIDRYNLDGIDLDIEGGALNLNPDDKDIFHPTTPQVVYLIDACHALRKHYGRKFMLTMAPPTENIDAVDRYDTQNGWLGWGCYLPLIYGVRDILTFVAPQEYNVNETVPGVDGAQYTCGTPDFDVAVTELLLAGYKAANGQRVPPLRPRQVAFGVPASKSATDFGTGSLEPDIVLKVSRYIENGTPFGGAYKLRRSKGYGDCAGVMTWSINLDAANNYALAEALDPCVHPHR